MYSKTIRRRLIAPPSTLSNPAPSKWCRHWRYCTWLLTPHRMFTSYRLPESDFPDIRAFDSKPQPPSQFRKLQNRTIFPDVCYKSYTYHQWDDENGKCKRFESKSCHPLTPSSPFPLTTTLQCIKATAPTVATEILIFTDTCLHICGQTWWQKLSGDSGWNLHNMNKPLHSAPLNRVLPSNNPNHQF